MFLRLLFSLQGAKMEEEKRRRRRGGGGGEEEEEKKEEMKWERNDWCTAKARMLY